MGCARSSGRRSIVGFTLAELLITIAVVAILMAIALPSYQSQIRKSRRADAINALMTVQFAEEKYRANNPGYTTLATLGFANPMPSPDGYYTVAAVGTPNATSFTMRATAVAGKSQNSDTGCTQIDLVVVAGAITQTPATCWNR